MQAHPETTRDDTVVKQPISWVAAILISVFLLVVASAMIKGFGGVGIFAGNSSITEPEPVPTLEELIREESVPTETMTETETEAELAKAESEPTPKATVAPKPAPKAAVAPKPTPKVAVAPKPAPKVAVAPKPAPKPAAKPAAKADDKAGWSKTFFSGNGKTYWVPQYCAEQGVQQVGSIGGGRVQLACGFGSIIPDPEPVVEDQKSTTNGNGVGTDVVPQSATDGGVVKTAQQSAKWLKKAASALVCTAGILADEFTDPFGRFGCRRDFYGDNWQCWSYKDNNIRATFSCA